MTKEASNKHKKGMYYNIIINLLDTWFILKHTWYFKFTWNEDLQIIPIPAAYFVIIYR